MHLLILLLISLNAQAFVASVSGFPTWFYHGRTQTIFLDPEFSNNYVDHTHTQVLASGEVFLGLQLPMDQLGIAFESTAPLELSGNIWETGDAKFNNFSYSYNLRHQFLSVKNKLIYAPETWVYFPYFSFNLGLAWNQSYGFHSVSLISEAYPTSNFTNQMQLSFAYKLGAGLQKKMNDHWQASIGYEFANWGHSGLGRAPGQTQNQGIRLNASDVNQIAMTISYNT